MSTHPNMKLLNSEAYLYRHFIGRAIAKRDAAQEPGLEPERKAHRLESMRFYARLATINGSKGSIYK